MGKERRLKQLKFKVEKIGKRIIEIGHIPDSLLTTKEGIRLHKEKSDLIRTEALLHESGLK